MEPIIRIEKVDGHELAQEFSDEIEKMLGSKMKSVKVSMLTWNSDLVDNFCKNRKTKMEKNHLSSLNKIAITHLKLQIQGKVRKEKSHLPQTGH